MKVLVLGSGGREHALAWRLSLDSNVESVLVFPGNPGMRITPKLEMLQGEVTFTTALKHVTEHSVSLVVVGPEKFLFEGWVDQFTAAGVPAFGPTAAASFLEASKIRSKVFMRKNDISTAPFEVARTLAEALKAIDAHPKWSGYVLKLSGPALGKGVIVTRNKKDARIAAEQFFEFRPPGIEEGMVIEDCVTGREVSLFYACVDEKYRFLASACDHKRLNDKDEGPNTGGMGAYSPATWVDQDMLRQIEVQFVKPTLRGMKKQGTPFRGMLFLGLMVSENSSGAPKLSLLEYNTRFGDPETQTFLPLLEGNFAGLLLAAAQGDQEAFTSTPLKNKDAHAVHVVKAAKGYPGLFGGEIESGKKIEWNQNLAKSPTSAQVFFAGVSTQSTNREQLITSGGRVLGITAEGSSKEQARLLVYESLSLVKFENEHFRKDIGAAE